MKKTAKDTAAELISGSNESNKQRKIIEKLNEEQEKDFHGEEEQHIEQEEKHWGTDSFYHKSAIEHKENILKKWRAGEVVEVDSDCDSYNDRWLYSDGTIREQHWGD